jgi:4'-phosphopantetheinyl transferase
VTDAIVYYRPLAGLSYAALAGRWLRPLPYAKRQAIERSPERSAHATLAGIDLLAHGALALGNEPLDAASLVYPERGKPYLPGGPEFSISHTSDLAVCAVACGIKLGIDIEIIARVRESMLRRVASAEEIETFRDAECGPAALWTRKEAVLKAAGASIFGASEVTVRRDDGEYHGQRWYFCGPETLEGCAFALACERPGVAVDLRRATRLA